MKRLLQFSLIIWMLLPAGLSAQSYILSGGLRLGEGYTGRMVGLTAQQRFAKRYTLEEIIQTDFSRNTTFHVLAKKHIPLVTRRLNVYGGAGFSIGSEESRSTIDGETVTTTGNPAMGMDVVAGAEFTLAKMNVSIDYKPNLNLAGGRRPRATGQVAISVRKVLVKGNFFKKLKRKRKRNKRQRARDKAREEREREREKNGEKLPDWWPLKK